MEWVQYVRAKEEERIERVFIGTLEEACLRRGSAAETLID